MEGFIALHLLSDCTRLKSECKRTPFTYSAVSKHTVTATNACGYFCFCSRNQKIWAATKHEFRPIVGRKKAFAHIFVFFFYTWKIFMFWFLSHANDLYAQKAILEIFADFYRFSVHWWRAFEQSKQSHPISHWTYRIKQFHSCKSEGIFHSSIWTAEIQLRMFPFICVLLAFRFNENRMETSSAKNEMKMAWTSSFRHLHFYSSVCRIDGEIVNCVGAQWANVAW